jgi:hypothetical protein
MSKELDLSKLNSSASDVRAEVKTSLKAAVESAREADATAAGLATPPAMLNPEAQAFMNAAISKTVREIFAEMAPIFSSMALTPQKMAEAEAIRRAPTEDQLAYKARMAREKAAWHLEIEESTANKAKMQSNCPHAYVTGGSAWNPIRNYPDRQERFICALCHSLAEPRRWVIDAPDNANPRGRAHVVDATPNYLEARKVLTIKG